MNSVFKQQVFFGKNSLSSLSCIALVIMASTRLAFALTMTFALVWVYVLTTVAVFFAKPILPKEGKIFVLIFLSSFIGCLLLFVIWFFSPFLSMASMYLVLLIPCCFIGSFLSEDTSQFHLIDTVLDSLWQAVILGGFIIGLSLIREPLGFKTLSLPGGSEGIIELFKELGDDDFLPIRILSTSTGAFWLLGYIVALLLSLKRQSREVL